jgi:hypothetical protein
MALRLLPAMIAASNGWRAAMGLLNSSGPPYARPDTA